MRPGDIDIALARRAKEIFDRLLRLPRAARGESLDEICGRAPGELRDEVERLLGREATLGDFLEQPLRPPGEPHTPSAARAGAGARVGAYRLVEPLGRGGTGDVWLAEREGADFRQRVAVKVLRSDVDSRELEARFRAERQILAGLDHPHIARLIDGGVDQDVAFLAVELVEGQPITAWCDARRLGLAERLRLFRKVLAAVSYAHRNLVVHRDLKPSNILVGQDGQPKLLDFGIAKLLDADADLTSPAVRRLTPNYASPEHLAGWPVTTASDVYSLGVLLHQLLVGRLPFDWAGHGPEAIASALYSAPPAPPSERLGGEDVLEVAARRACTPATLRRRLAGDLDAIVLQALRADPRERTASADDLARDVERFLEGRPVASRPPGPLERAVKWVRRNRPLAAALAAAVTLLGVLATLGPLQAARIARERDAALRERRKAERITRFVVDTFGAVDPTRTRGATVTVREALGLAAAGLRDDQAVAPAERAALLHTLGTVAAGLGLYGDARERLEQALRLRRANGDEPLDLAATLHELGAVETSAGQPAQGRARLAEALALRRRWLGPSQAGAVATLVELANAALELGEHAAAETQFREALALARAPNAEAAKASEGLARARERLGDPDEAERLYRDVIQMRLALLGADHPDLAATRNDLGWLLVGRGRFDEAEALLRQALADFRRVLGDEHPYVGTVLNNLGLALLQRGRYRDAEPVVREGLERRRRTLGEHAEVASGLANLAWALLLGRGDYEAAEPLVRESLALVRRLFGERHPDTALAANNLGVVLLDRGDVARAEPFLRQALALREELLGAEHPQTLSTRRNLAWVPLERGDYRAAVAALEALLAAQRARLGALDPEVAATLADLGLARQGTRDFAAAEALLRQALRLQEAAFGAGHPVVANTRVRLARLLVERGAHDEAAALARSALECYSVALDGGHWRVADADSVLAAAQLASGGGREAARRLAAAGATIRRRRGGVWETRWIAARLASAGLSG